MYQEEINTKFQDYVWLDFEFEFHGDDCIIQASKDLIYYTELEIRLINVHKHGVITPDNSWRSTPNEVNAILKINVENNLYKISFFNDDCDDIYFCCIDFTFKINN